MIDNKMTYTYSENQLKSAETAQPQIWHEWYAVMFMMALVQEDL